MNSPTKVDFRLVRKTTTLGGVRLSAGTIVMLCLGAANREPRKFDHPHQFRPDRRNVREHISFGRDIHTCAGAPLARAEGQITVRRLLDRMSDIRIDESVHGAGSQRRYAYDPTFLLRGLTQIAHRVHVCSLRSRNCSRNLTLSTLPVAVCGSSSTKITSSNSHHLATSPAR